MTHEAFRHTTFITHHSPPHYIRLILLLDIIIGPAVTIAYIIDLDSLLLVHTLGRISLTYPYRSDAFFQAP